MGLCRQKKHNMLLVTFTNVYVLKALIILLLKLWMTGCMLLLPNHHHDLNIVGAHRKEATCMLQTSVGMLSVQFCLSKLLSKYMYMMSIAHNTSFHYPRYLAC